MSLPLILSCLWVVIAHIGSLLPTKDYHWRFAYVLMAVGFPLLIWVIMTDGWIFGLMLIFAAASVFRWPLYYLWKYIKRKTNGTAKP